MKTKNFTGPAISKGDSHVHSYLAGLGSFVQGLGDCSFDSDTGETICTDPLPMQTPSSTGLPPIISAPSSTPINYNPILSQLTNIFGKIATQVTQPVGTQQTVCNAQGICSSSSTVYPSNYQGYPGGIGIGIPGSFGAGIGSFLPWIIGGLVVFGVIKAASK